MIKNFLSGIIGRGSADTRNDAIAKQSTALPSIGRKSDLIPVVIEIEALYRVAAILAEPQSSKANT